MLLLALLEAAGIAKLGAGLGAGVAAIGAGIGIGHIGSSRRCGSVRCSGLPALLIPLIQPTHFYNQVVVYAKLAIHNESRLRAAFLDAAGISHRIHLSG